MSNNTQYPSAKGAFFAIAATLFWAGNLVIARVYTAQASPVGLAFYRWWVALAILTPICFSSFWKNRRILWQFRGYLILCSLLAVTLFTLFLYIASETVPAVELALISTSLPAFILLISVVWLGDAVRLNQVLGILLAIMGIVTLITEGDWQVLTALQAKAGYAWMIGATMLFAVYSVILRNRPGELNGWLFLYSTVTLGFLFLLPCYLWELVRSPALVITPEFIAAIVYLGLFASIGSYYCWNQAVHLIGPIRTAPFYYLIVAFSGVGGWLFLNEPMGWLHLLCMGLIVSGIFVANLGKDSV